MNIVQCYAPTEQAEREEKEKFYNQLQNTVNQIKKREIVIVMGDINTKVSEDNTDLEQVMGRHGIDQANENGEMFVD